MQDADKKRANVVRFGLMVIPPLAWAITFSYLFLIARGLYVDWIGAALIPSLINAVVVAVVCVVVWFAYLRLVLKAK